MIFDNLSNMRSQFLCFLTRICFSVDTNNILCARRTSKCAALDVITAIHVDFCLGAWRGVELAFSVRGLEQRSIEYLNFKETIGEINVGVFPFLWTPALVSQDYFGKEHVRQGITNSLVDEVNAGFEGVERILLARRLWLSVPNELDSWIGEENSAMTVSLEVDTNIESLRGVVEMLDASRRADNRKLEHLLDIFG